MSKCSHFLTLAKNFSNKLRQLSDKGIATEESLIETWYRRVHEPEVRVLFPNPDPKNIPAIYPSTFPISYNEYMQGIAQPTNDEVISFLSYMKEEGMYVVNPTQLNRPERLFIRNPPNPVLRAYGHYGHVRFSASVSSQVNYQFQGPNKIFSGRSIAYFDHNYNFCWDCGWYDSNSVQGPYTDKQWEKLVALEEVKALLNGISGKSGSSLSNTSPFQLGPFVNFIGNNMQVIECLNGTSKVPDFLFTTVAEVLVVLKDYKGYTFSYEHREQNGIAEFVANMRMRIARGDTMVPQQEWGKFTGVKSEHYSKKTAFRFEY